MAEWVAWTFPAAAGRTQPVASYLVLPTEMLADRLPPPDPSARRARPLVRLARRGRIGPSPAPARQLHRQRDRELPAPRRPMRGAAPAACGELVHTTGCPVPAPLRTEGSARVRVPSHPVRRGWARRSRERPYVPR